MNFWMENAQNKDSPPHVIVDCGYTGHKAARNNADKLLKIVSRNNLMIPYAGRILVRIPPAKLAEIKQRFASIHNKPTYAWTQLKFVSGPQFDFKYALK